MANPFITGVERVYTITADGRKLTGTATGVVAGRVVVLLDEPYETMVPDPYADAGKESELIRVPVTSIEVHERDLRYLDVVKAATPQASYVPPPADPEVAAEEAAARKQTGAK